VRPPQHLVLRMDSFPGSYYAVNSALLYGEQRSIRTTVMDQVMHFLAEHFVNLLVSQCADAGRVTERASVFEIDPVNSFGSRVEKKSEFILTFAQCLYRPLVLGDVRSHAENARLTVQLDQFRECEANANTALSHTKTELQVTKTAFGQKPLCDFDPFGRIHPEPNVERR